MFKIFCLITYDFLFTKLLTNRNYYSYFKANKIEIEKYIYFWSLLVTINTVMIKVSSICGNYLGYLHGKIMVSRTQILLCDDVWWCTKIVYELIVHTRVVRTYVIHLLGTYVTILYNLFILWQNALYLCLGRSRMCLILQEIVFQDQVLKMCKSIHDSSWRSAIH